MPFVSIERAALILSGKLNVDDSFRPHSGNFQPGEHSTLMCEELITGAQLGKIAATEVRLLSGRIKDPPKYGIDYTSSKVDLDDARTFLIQRGLLNAVPATPKGRRENQLEILEAKARGLGIDLMQPKKGDKASLGEVLKAEYPGYFTNFEDIWKDAKKAGIARPINVSRKPRRRE